ncbi:alpha/beta hydrolase [Corynebacterium lubricantis]|uniref:alpha/beta hydrolase n=1 Tax=Corynebacterium lubricantis TaxID=541095 RepID=UPI0003668690|nr:alpha/beta hydrolase [Corynebacterium lubricantis]
MSDSKVSQRHRPSWLHFNRWGLVFAAIFFTLGLTPSLLLRDWFYQGLVSGVSAGVGYGIGVLVHWLVVKFVVWRRISIPESRWRIIDIALASILLIWMLAVIILSSRWQRGLAELTEGIPSPLWQRLLILPTGLVVALLVVGVGRGARWVAQRIRRALPERLAPTVRGAVGWVAVLLVAAWLVETAIPGSIVATGERIFSVRNANAEPGRDAPAETERAGSPTSSLSWDGVGAYGSRFLDQGLNAEELEELSGEPAKEPIRLYAGIQHAPTDAQRAELIIDELERTKATEREAILVTMTTGTGWVNSSTAQAFELLYNGDTAIAAEQYSSMPSAFHFFAGGEAVQTAGREFITPILDWWNKLPEDDRPKLYLYGESLGTTAVESAFSGMRDIANSVDGILLAGPPNFNPLWPEFTSRRDPGTPEVKPEYSAGMVVRFANNNQDIAALTQDEIEWGPTRMLYLQHPSDPVVWWSPELIFTEPDWLKEDPGFDRLPEMGWAPFVTFLQLSADLPVSQNVPDGHGHNYGNSMVPGFAAIAPDGRFDEAYVRETQDRLGEALVIGD